MSHGVVEKKVYSAYERRLMKEVANGGRMPKHIAIIMDGNRRYATEILGDTEGQEGHLAGKAKLLEVAEWCINIGIPYITVYAFSTENFNRTDKEVEFLMDLAAESFREMADNELVQKNRIRIQALGNLEILPDNVREAIEYARERTGQFTEHVMSVCIAYGGRQEIVEATRRIACRVRDGEISPEDINEDMVTDHLYSSGLPDPDLVLRTSGEVRISNFLLWQLAYSELYFSDVYWPGFRYIDLLRAIRTYQQRVRRYGA
jgi:tritrans,polycis-undecaprenyl-diphosphate synthase [geranylgeranyl-diphosphate specific]